MKVFASLLILLFAGLAAADLYDYRRSPVVQLTSSNFKSKVLDTNETWFVEFYAPWCGHCKNLVPAYEKAADHLKGVVNFGGVNCDDHKDIAQKYGIRGFPTIKVFKGSGSRARRPTEYQGARTAKAFVDQAKSELPNNVVEIKSGGIDAFLDDEKQLPHVILFTDKTTTSHLYKSLSSAFLGKASLGEIRKREADAIKEKFGVTEYPSFVTFHPGANADGGTKYEGETDPTTLRNFIANLIGETAGTYTEETIDPKKVKTDEEAKQTFYKPQEHDVGADVVLGTGAFNRLCLKRLDGSTCIAGFVTKSEKMQVVKDTMTELSSKYKFDNLAFVVVDVSAGNGGEALSDALSIDKSAGACIAAIRGRKLKYAISESSYTEISVASGVSFLDRVLGGDISYKKMSPELPEWGEVAIEVEESESAEGETTEGGESGSTTTGTKDEGSSGEAAEEPAGKPKAKAKEFGAGSENDPQVHPGEKCEQPVDGKAKGEKEEL